LTSTSTYNFIALWKIAGGRGRVNWPGVMYYNRLINYLLLQSKIMTPINQSSGLSSHELHIHLRFEKPSLLGSSVSSSDDTPNSLHEVLENIIASDKQDYSPLALCNVLNSDWSFCVGIS
jgi:hypothetical protein